MAVDIMADGDKELRSSNLSFLLFEDYRHTSNQIAKRKSSLNTVYDRECLKCTQDLFVLKNFVENIVTTQRNILLIPLLDPVGVGG